MASDTNAVLVGVLGFVYACLLIAGGVFWYLLWLKSRDAKRYKALNIILAKYLYDAYELKNTVQKEYVETLTITWEQILNDHRVKGASDKETLDAYSSTYYYPDEGTNETIVMSRIQDDGTFQRPK